MIAAFVLIKAAPGRVADLASELTDVEGVAEVYSVTGDHDLIVVVRVRSHDDLAQVVPGNLSSLPGILETQTMVAFKAYSRHDLDSMWSLGAG